MEEISKDNEYQDFIKQVKEKIYNAQYEAMKEVNKQLIKLYWDIGSLIVEKQEQLNWGKSIVEELSIELRHEFADIKGFSTRNLWNMRSFYLNYKDSEKLQLMVAEISWTKNIIIIDKCKDELEREFYIKMTKKFGWTKDVLANQIESKAYEKFLLNQTNFDNTLAEKFKNQAKLALKDEYVFDFLELGEEYSEKELENRLVTNIQEFLLEMGNYFTFIGNQYKITIDNDDYYIDLLLYHRKLKSLVAIELKIGDFKPEYVGKMQFYLSVLDDKARFEGENNSIGIIICKNKNRTVVEYALSDAKKPIGIATYTFENYLPDEIKRYLPSPDEIAKKIQAID